MELDNRFCYYVKGYRCGIFAVADFLNSEKTFDKWYGDGPFEVCVAWRHLLKTLGREKEFYDLEEKLHKDMKNAS